MDLSANCSNGVGSRSSKASYLFSEGGPSGACRAEVDDDMSAGSAATLLWGGANGEEMRCPRMRRQC
eukprot:CAMPEP_0173246184 /NCGR_PEP_ID=MMETSP1142-20121109/17174_1 /TAXON_ID=483371 /ORGANISM="non described non described, Strain CCMP2298" /LENGTH=66 /DNA_ID=CAMNT_0014178375 /DNA_START=1150 /DNA_END=1347 /DNA_ORIENTATION=-